VKDLDSDRVFKFVDGVFGLQPNDDRIVIFIDLPHGSEVDTEDWRWLREFAARVRYLFPKKNNGRRHLMVELVAYASTGEDGAPLPKEGFLWPWGLPERLEEIPTYARQTDIAEVLRFTDCALFATRWSATHQLKHMVAGGHMSVRVATLPGFTAEMMPALEVDFVEAERRAAIIKALLDQAVSAEIWTAVERLHCRLFVDLRHRDFVLDNGQHPYECLASTGRILVPGQVGNGIPAETYVAPYDDQGDSKTSGFLPIQHIPSELPVIYRFDHNRVVEVIGDSPVAHAERALLKRDPTRGNLGELGFGVLDGLGAPPLRDVRDPDAVMLYLEKGGFHAALGKGGRTDAPIHRDHVFLEAYMPGVRLVSITLHMADGTTRLIMSGDNYVPDLFSLGV
jgi:hypothetical protein